MSGMRNRKPVTVIKIPVFTNKIEMMPGKVLILSIEETLQIRNQELIQVWALYGIRDGIDFFSIFSEKIFFFLFVK
jgi:hypothetical protein